MYEGDLLLPKINFNDNNVVYCTDQRDRACVRTKKPKYSNKNRAHVKCILLHCHKAK